MWDRQVGEVGNAKKSIRSVRISAMLKLTEYKSINQDHRSSYVFIVEQKQQLLPNWMVVTSKVEVIEIIIIVATQANAYSVPVSIPSTLNTRRLCSCAGPGTKEAL